MNPCFRVDSILVRTKLYLDECLACELNVEDIPWTDIFQVINQNKFLDLLLIILCYHTGMH